MSNLTLGAILRGYRETIGFTIDQVEFITGISKPFLNSIETDKIGHPARYYLMALCSLYKINFNVLLSTAEQKEPEPDFEKCCKQQAEMYAHDLKNHECATDFINIREHAETDFQEGAIWAGKFYSKRLLEGYLANEEIERLKAENEILENGLFAIANWPDEMCGWLDAGVRARGTAQSILKKQKEGKK